MGRLTTHILDTAHGGPATGVDIRLYSIGDARELIASATTNDDGRTPYPLLEGDLMKSGTYELEFDIGNYFRKRGAELADPPFLGTVVIRVALGGDDDYHVPLLASPWSYSTYRGS
jgi:5-hydroxyisourate hydrolase